MIPQRNNCLALVFALLAIMGCSDGEVETESESVKLKAQYALEAWRDETWIDMYSILSTSDKNEMTEAEFVRKRETLARSRKLVSYSIDAVSRTGTGQYLVEVTLNIAVDYNARADDSLKNKIESSSTEWQFVNDNGNLALTFIGR